MNIFQKNGFKLLSWISDKAAFISIPLHLFLRQTTHVFKWLSAASHALLRNISHNAPCHVNCWSHWKNILFYFTFFYKAGILLQTSKICLCTKLFLRNSSTLYDFKYMFTPGGLSHSYTDAFSHYAVAASALNGLQRTNFVLCVGSE